ncbi:MAG: type I DNA topoisomerase [Candidatus Omnitrophota bacterium]
MSKYLIIVESPTKARTLSSFLGKDYEISSSKGHVVDLPSSKLAVDVKGDFQPLYTVLSGKKKIISELKKKAKDKEAIYLATDPDREGEAISWHIKEKLNKKDKKFYRIIFHEITKDAIKEALADPGQLDLKKVQAQMARRVLDRVVGYRLSPLLWKKIVRGLSAGRVQSVALRFIVEKEREIEKFVPEITYSLEANFSYKEAEFEAKLKKYQDRKGIFKAKQEADECKNQLVNQDFFIDDILKKKNKRKPRAPHITSSLQQEAFNKLRFSAQKTMVVAQQLYEGITLEGENIGLITYMRTDSFAVSQKAKDVVAEFIKTEFGKNYLSKKVYKRKKKKGAQLAHEAIRPTDVRRRPDEIGQYLTKDQFRLYQLIWRRFTASFMAEAVFENIKIKIKTEQALFLAEDKKLVFPGFLKLYPQDQKSHLPGFTKGDKLRLKALEVKKHSTKPPARYNDASLIKILEEKGIGRPSTYAPTIFTLLRRNYARREKSYLCPTDLGIKVADFLIKHFKKIMDYGFTASMETKLDKVEEGKVVWSQILKNFYPDFQKQVEKVSKTIKKEVVYSDKNCPRCGGRLVVKWSRKGKFLSCENFPSCRYAESITTGIKCPDCNKGEILQRRNRRGQIFYGCTNFPECRYTIRNLDQLKESPNQDEEKDGSESK